MQFELFSHNASSGTFGKLLITISSVAGGLALSMYTYKQLSGIFNRRQQEARFQEQSKQWPKDVIILHAMKRGKLAPHPSPFVVKLETFLRMHKIPYIFDCQFPKGDKQKMPWITLNQKHYTDSQLIIEFLTKEYNLKPTNDKDFDEKQKAIGTLARVTMDDHFFWGLLLWRYVYAEGDRLDEIFNMTPNELKAFAARTFSKYTEFSWCQGLGRHSKDDVVKFVCDDLRALSQIIGKNKFLLGDEPCDDDCAVFGMLAQLIWNDIKSPYSELINDELTNLKEYCLRMRDKFWQDWDEVIRQGYESSNLK